MLLYELGKAQRWCMCTVEFGLTTNDLRVVLRANLLGALRIRPAGVRALERLRFIGIYSEGADAENGILTVMDVLEERSLL